MPTLSSFSSLSKSHFDCLSCIFTRLYISSFSSVASITKRSNSSPNIYNYLIKTFGFTEARALSISNRFWWAKDPEKPESVVHFLRQFGISDTHIRNSLQLTPQILFANVNKTLKPKLEFFHELGINGNDLSHFLSRSSPLLTVSLDKKLIPCVEILKKILSESGDHRDLVTVIQRCHWVITKDPESILLRNISILKSCGIVGSQLSTLLKRQPVLFIMRESTLRDLVRNVEELGFTSDSRMFVHALFTFSCMSNATLQRKFELFRSYGFTEEQYMSMFRRSPGLLRASEGKLKLGIEFFTKVIGLERTVLINRPSCLMHSIERKVIPRYRVLEILKSKRLLKKEPKFFHVALLPEKEFLEKFISKFTNDAEELLVAYKGDVLDSSDE